MKRIDLNADIGEGMASDAELVPLLSSANIACGAHAGDAHTMAASVALCARHGVAIGAHPSYPDRAHFGRRALALPAAAIRATLDEQIDALAQHVLAAGARLVHVKPHGALYNRAAVDPEIAAAVADAVHAFDPALTLVGLAGSRLLEAGRSCGLRVLAEGFADRRYTASGELVSRTDPRALIEDAEESVAQVLAMLRGSRLRAVDGCGPALDVDTVCLHGDGAHALVFARRLRAALAVAGIEIRASAP